MSSFVLKMIACLSMLIDHAGVIFRADLPDIAYTVLRCLGRPAFVIFAFFIVEGFIRTRNRTAYALRLALFAILSEIPFDLMGSGSLMSFSGQNIFFTLLLGLLGMWGYETLKNRNLSYLGFLPMFAAAYAANFLRTDYAAFGVVLIFVIYLFKENKMAQGIGVGVVTLVMMTGMRLQLFGFVGWLLCCAYNGKRGPKMTYFFYLFYPLHILLLLLLREVLG